MSRSRPDWREANSSAPYAPDMTECSHCGERGLHDETVHCTQCGHSFCSNACCVDALEGAHADGRAHRSACATAFAAALSDRSSALGSGLLHVGALIADGPGPVSIGRRSLAKRLFGRTKASKRNPRHYIASAIISRLTAAAVSAGARDWALAADTGASPMWTALLTNAMGKYEEQTFSQNKSTARRRSFYSTLVSMMEGAMAAADSVLVDDSDATGPMEEVQLTGEVMQQKQALIRSATAYETMFLKDKEQRKPESRRKDIDVEGIREKYRQLIHNVMVAAHNGYFDMAKTLIASGGVQAGAAEIPDAADLAAGRIVDGIVALTSSLK